MRYKQRDKTFQKCIQFRNTQTFIMENENDEILNFYQIRLRILLILICEHTLPAIILRQ